MIGIIDYGLGNIGSIVNMLKKIRAPHILVSNPEELKGIKKIILPGVGSFDAGASNLKATSLWDAIKVKVLDEQVPLLGICLGMQLLFNKSEEGKEDGLGLVSGEIKRFDFSQMEQKLKIPHMGWNVVTPTKTDPLFFHMPHKEMRFYFTHSYHAVCAKPENILAVTSYGYEFTCVVRNGNIFGVQFHPEKSHKFGMQLLKNFAEL